MSARHLYLVVPGDLRTPTGGYVYDRRLIAELAKLGWRVQVHPLDPSFPHPTPQALRQAAAVLQVLSDGALVLLDGLGLGALPHVVRQHAARLKLVGLVHHPLAAETGLSGPAVRRLRESERLALQSMRRVAVTSRATARALLGYGVPRARLAVLEPGTDAPARRPRRDDIGRRAAPRPPGATCRSIGTAHRSAGISSRPVHMLCVSAVIPRKGHDLLVSALSNLVSLPWHLTCAGSLTRSAPTVRRLRTQLRRCGLTDRVTLTGELSDARLAQLHQRADLFVLPTRYEGYGMAVAEALSHGLPVVSTRVGAIPQLVGSQAGLLVAPGDEAGLAAALERVLRDRALREALRRGATRARRALPRWRDLGRAWSALLEQVARTA